MDEKSTKLIKEENISIVKQLATLKNQMKAMISLYRDVVIDNGMLEKRIKKLEQVETYFPFTEKEIKNFKLGGTYPE